jgi:hypothetical protein
MIRNVVCEDGSNSFLGPGHGKDAVTVRHTGVYILNRLYIKSDEVNNALLA